MKSLVIKFTFDSDQFTGPGRESGRYVSGQLDLATFEWNDL